MQVNFASPVQLAHKLLQRDRWKERRHGRIVAITSLMGRGASPLNAAYSATKHALRGYFLALAAEERSWLRVDVVLPGAVNTGLWDASWNSKNEDVGEKSSMKQLQADDRSKMPVKRCVQLIISSMIGPSYLVFGETWISQNPGLLWVYLASYTPSTFHVVMTNIV
jgi:short-subunit dehydrogenase